MPFRNFALRKSHVLNTNKISDNWRKNPSDKSLREFLQNGGRI